MSRLTELIQVKPPDQAEEEAEDIFAFAAGLIFPDDLRNTHGDPGSTIIYKSRRFGEIGLKTADPEGETERRLFSHYLWNAGIKLAELISEENSVWNVAGERVLELGAGVGLDGIVSCLANAEEVVISDYPAPVVLQNIKRNAQGAIPASLRSKYRVEGHEWGVLDSPFARDNSHRFTRILAADCYWMGAQHDNIVRSMLHFLSPGSDACVYVVAGFHTGRAKLAAFFEIATEQGLVAEEIYEEDANGVRREWRPERDGGYENHTERKRWLVIARLKRTVLTNAN